MPKLTKEAGLSLEEYGSDSTTAAAEAICYELAALREVLQPQELAEMEVAKERAAVVKWLRERSEVWRHNDGAIDATVADVIADNIEAGKHRKGW